jgi:hypothetical protein
VLLSGRYPGRELTAQQEPTSLIDICGRRTEESSYMSSPLLHLLNTNDAPSVSEVELIQNTLLMSQSRLASLRDEISRVQSVMDDLVKEQAAVQRCFEEHKALLSPIRRLPAELLSAIFMLCLPEDWRSVSCNALEAPMLLSRICGHWRAVAIATPAIWSYINLTFGPDTITSQIPLLEIWLSRSGGSTLSVQLDDTPAPVIDLLLPHSNRFQHLHVGLPLEMFHKISVVENRLNLLETLVIEVLRDASSGVITPLRSVIHSFQSAPRLRTVHLGEGVPAQMVALPWAQLTDCVADYCDINDCLQIFSKSPQLVHCMVEYRLGSRSMPYPFPPNILQLTRLVSFHLVTWSNPSPLFDTIALSSLRSIQIEYPVEFDHWPQSSFVSLLHRSSRSLSILTFINVALTSGGLIQCLQETPLLNELEVWDCAQCINSELFDLLTLGREPGDNNAPPLVPALQELSLCGTFSVGGGCVEMVQSRWQQGSAGRGVVGLKHVQLFSHGRDEGSERSDAEAIQRMGEFRGQGLVISVTFNHKTVV